jgi:hypothetical protein
MGTFKQFKKCLCENLITSSPYEYNSPTSRPPRATPVSNYVVYFHLSALEYFNAHNFIGD